MKKLICLLMLSTLVACGGNSTSNNQANSNAGSSQIIQNNNSQTTSATNNAVSELIFGEAFGSCQGESCIETYRLTDSSLFEDSVDDYKHASFDFTQLDNDRFQKAKALLTKIPDELWSIPAGNVGCPDCADRGGVYVQYAKDGETKSWFIDNDLNQIPTALHDFVKEIQATVATINNQSTENTLPNSENETVPELIFGKAFGHCQGESCIETYRLTNSSLFEDSIDDYSHASFNFSQLDNDSFQKAKALLTKVPTELWNTPTGNVGCPDCADGGGVYVKYTKDGETKSWFIDNNLAQVPTALHNFVKEVQSTVAAINNESTDTSGLPLG